MTAFFNFVRDILNALLQLFVDGLSWLSVEIKLIFFWIAESVLGIVQIILFSVIDGLGLVSQWNSLVTQIPPTAIFYMQATGVFEAISILIAAMAARFAITLIPGVGN